MGTATRSEVGDGEHGRRILRAILGQGFILSTLYCVFGLAIELSHALLPAAIYERAAAAVYGVPLRLLVHLDLQSDLISAVAQGRLPAWLAGAAVPALGVALILGASLIVAAGARLGAQGLSLKQS
jgi:hypothetical protein